jgi:hypothetical protein
MTCSSISTRLWNGQQFVHHGVGGADRLRHEFMTVLLIIIVLLVVFPSLSRMIGGCLSIMLWLVVLVVALAVFGTMSN